MRNIDDFSIEELKTFSIIFRIIGILCVVISILLPFLVNFIAIITGVIFILYSSYYANLIKKRELQSNSTQNTVHNSVHSPSKTNKTNGKLTDKSSAELLLKKIKESYDIMETTVKPDVFFRRIHFILNSFLCLIEYDESIFSGVTPEEEYRNFKSQLENTVNRFIERSYLNELEEATKLKTESGRKKRLQKYIANMEIAFEHANEFYTSYERLNYTGSLYTVNNLEKIKSIKSKYYSN